MITLFLAPSSLLATDASKAEASISDMVSKAADAVGQLNINTASVESLANIPGIGTKISEAIATYREAHGTFKSVSDLVNVEGIDAALLEKIKPFLTL
jgi:competence protein ComEA